MEENRQNPNKYEHSKVYAIRNDVDDDIYIGSTTSALSKRFYEHKRELNKTQIKPYRLYKKMIELGFEHFYIELVEEVKCQNREQLLKVEGKYIREMGTLNKLIAGRTRQEYQKECQKEYRKEYQKEYQKEYRKGYMAKLLQKEECSCGMMITRCNMKRHKQRHNCQ